jgi:hypothetical protein
MLVDYVPWVGSTHDKQIIVISKAVFYLLLKLKPLSCLIPASIFIIFLRGTTKESNLL